jgi:glutamyl-Q tRNA(Asp) synthetase
VRTPAAPPNIGTLVYRGRFAPSPTGPLHFGSLVAALGSYLCARQAQGEWHVRIDDLDRPRVVPGAADHILRTLEEFGFEWSGPVVYQSQRTEAYAAAFEELRRHGHLFECSCSRRELQMLGRDQGDQVETEELRYPGLCRRQPLAPDRPTSSRFRVPHGLVSFNDRFQGTVSADVESESGDFIVRRRDGLFAYQLACVVADHEEQFTHVVRGVDLLGSTARQILLQRALGYTIPNYGHLPLVTDAEGRKLSKSTAAPAIEGVHAPTLLWRALTSLQQRPPRTLKKADLQELWAWAMEHWTTEGLLNRRAVPYDDGNS